MRNFTVEDFSGAGQYLLRMTREEIDCLENNKPFRGYGGWVNLSTIIYKVGYIQNNFKIGSGEQLITMTAMSDGWTKFNHYPNRDKAEQYKKKGNKLTLMSGKNAFGKMMIMKQKMVGKNLLTISIIILTKCDLPLRKKLFVAC